MSVLKRRAGRSDRDGLRGPSLPLSSKGIDSAADTMSVDAARIWTILRVETMGCGFIADRPPQILFERHRFHRQTNGAFSRTAPDISNQQPGGYGQGGAAQYERLGRAWFWTAAPPCGARPGG
jgi:hypothetical protein